MADDKKYSLDDILEELASKQKDQVSEITRHNTDIFVPPMVKPDIGGILGSPDKKTENEPVIKPEAVGLPAGKPPRASRELNSQSRLSADADLSSPPSPKQEKPPTLTKVTPVKKPPARGFSEKTSFSSAYTEETKSKKTFSDKIENSGVDTDKLEAAGLHFKSDKYVIPDNATRSQAYREDLAAIRRAELKKRADAILSEMDEDKPDVFKSIAQTYHKAITGFFTRVLPRPEDTADLRDREAGLIDREELLSDSHRRLTEKKRGEPQVRRKASDVNLNLSGKILPDTYSFSASEEQKILELQKRRNDKVREFKLVGEENENNVIEEATQDGEYESYENAKDVYLDIIVLRRTFIIRTLIIFICTILGFFIAISNDLPEIGHPLIFDKIANAEYFIVINCILGIIAAVAALPVVGDGFSKILSLKPNGNSPMSLAIGGAVLLTGAAYFQPLIISGGWVQCMVPVACASLFFSMIGKIAVLDRARVNFKPFSGAEAKYAVYTVEDPEAVNIFTRGVIKDVPKLAAYGETEFVEGFMKNLYASDIYDRFCRTSAPITVACSLIIGIIAFALSYANLGSDAVFAGFSAMVSVLTLCAGFMNLQIVNIPEAAECSKLSKEGAVLLGYEGIEEFAETNSVLADGASLFPNGSISLAGIKLFSDTRIDEAIVEAASLTHLAQSILDSMFYDIIRGKTELLSPVESYIYEDGMGLCGWINNRRVLLGNRELMLNHSIEGLPPATKEADYTGKRKSAVYLSVGGHLSAMFIIDMLPNVEIADALDTLNKKGVTVILRTVDSIINISKLSDMFDVPSDMFKLIPYRHHEAFETQTAYAPRRSANAVVTGLLRSFAKLVSSAKKLRAVIFTGLGLQMVSMILGALIVLVMVVLGSVKDVTATFAGVYCIVFWAVMTLIQSVSRVIK
jgi:Cu+-exporting ATPase